MDPLAHGSPEARVHGPMGPVFDIYPSDKDTEYVLARKCDRVFIRDMAMQRQWYHRESPSEQHGGGILACARRLAAYIGKAAGKDDNDTTMLRLALCDSIPSSRPYNMIDFM